MPSGLAYPVSQANEPGSILVPGESFSPFLYLYDEPPQPDQLSITVPPVATTLVAPSAPVPSAGIDWVVVLVIAGIVLIAMGGNGS